MLAISLSATAVGLLVLALVHALRVAHRESHERRFGARRLSELRFPAEPPARSAQQREPEPAGSPEEPTADREKTPGPLWRAWSPTH